MSLENLGKRIANIQTKTPWAFIILLLITLLISIPGLPMLINHVEPSIEKVLPQEVDAVMLMNDMRSQYGADMVYLVITPDPESPLTDLRDPSVINFVGALSDKMRSEANIRSVDSAADIFDEVPNDIDLSKTIISKNPMGRMFFNDDYSVMLVHVRSDTGSNSESINKVWSEIKGVIESMQSRNPGVNIEVTGFNMIDKATFQVIIHDFMFITIFSFAFILFFLFIYFRSVKKVLLSVSVIMISLILTLGITGYLGITMTVVTMVAAAMIMALGISYGIHVVHRYNELRTTKSRKAALSEMQEELVRALLGSSLTTSAGFLALLFGVLPAMKNLGIILAMGIIITLLVSVLFLPVLLYLWDRTGELSKADCKNSRKRIKNKR